MDIIAFLIVFGSIYFVYKKIKNRSRKKISKRVTETKSYPNLNLVDSILKKHNITFSTDNPDEMMAHDCFQIACEAWIEDDYKTARTEFQKTAALLRRDDVPQYKLDNFLELASEFVEHDSLFHYIKNDIISVICNNPNILQTDIYGLLKSYSKNDIQYALYYAELKGYITRTKKGRSYILNLGQNQ